MITLIEARRLSERLRALGREPLSNEDVQQVATMLARAGGYRRVFARPDRRLWREVLEPLAGRGEGLSPFEVFYLSEITVEQLGTRHEGLVLDVSGRAYERDEGYAIRNGSLTSQYASVGPVVTLQWTHNLDLNHQISVLLDASYSWWDYRAHHAESYGSADWDYDWEERASSLTGHYLWVLADRAVWSNRLAISGTRTSGTSPRFEFNSGPDTRNVQNVALRSSCDVYIEDHLSLVPTVAVGWNRNDKNSGRVWREAWDWNVELVSFLTILTQGFSET